MTENIWPAKLKLLTIWTFKKKNLPPLGLEPLEPSSVATQRNCLQNSQTQGKQGQDVGRKTLSPSPGGPEDISALNLTGKSANQFPFCLN